MEIRARPGGADEVRARVGRPRRIAVLLEPGRSGGAALDRAVAISREHEAELIVVAVEPQVAPPRCGGPSAGRYNEAVRAAVGETLAAAARRVRGSAPSPGFTLLVERRDPPLHRWIAEHEFDLVLLPARRSLLRSRRHPETRRLRRHLQAEIRVIAP